MKGRISNLELLKCLAIFLIVLSHNTPRNLLYPDFAPSTEVINNVYVDVTLPSTSILDIIVQYFTSFGQLGNAIFIICSCFFLCGSKGGAKRNKVWFLVSSSILISLLCFFVCKGMGFKLGWHHILFSLFPIASGGNWFVVCYIIFYIIHPLLNQVINNLPQRQHMVYILCGLYAWSIWPMLFHDAYLFFPLVQFVILFIIVSYLKKYKSFQCKSIRRPMLLIFIGFCGLFIHTLLINYISANVFKLPVLLNSLNPWVLLIAFSSFILFYNIPNFQNKIINHLSSLTLLIYLLDENEWVRMTIKPYVWSLMSYTENFIGVREVLSYTFLFSITSITICIIIGSLYRIIDKYIISKFMSVVDGTCVRLFDGIYSRLV